MHSARQEISVQLKWPGSGETQRSSNVLPGPLAADCVTAVLISVVEVFPPLLSQNDISLPSHGSVVGGVNFLTPWAWPSHLLWPRGS